MIAQAPLETRKSAAFRVIDHVTQAASTFFRSDREPPGPDGPYGSLDTLHQWENPVRVGNDVLAMEGGCDHVAGHRRWSPSNVTFPVQLVDIAPPTAS